MSLDPLKLSSTDDLQDIRIIRTRPRVPLHRLAQMMGVNPILRRQLLQREKYPSPFRVSYWPAERLFCDALRLGWSSDDLLGAATERWWPVGPEIDIVATRRRLFLAAAEKMAMMLEEVQLELESREACAHFSNRVWLPLKLGGVRVADTPGLVLTREHRGAGHLGLVSFHISKSRAHTERSAGRAASLLEAFARINQTCNSELVPDLCVVIDVFAGLVTDAAGDRSGDLREAELVCDEIAAGWSEL